MNPACFDPWTWVWKFCVAGQSVCSWNGWLPNPAARKCICPKCSTSWAGTHVGFPGCFDQQLVVPSNGRTNCAVHANRPPTFQHFHKLQDVMGSLQLPAASSTERWSENYCDNIYIICVIVWCQCMSQSQNAIFTVTTKAQTQKKKDPCKIELNIEM